MTSPFSAFLGAISSQCLVVPKMHDGQDLRAGD